MARKDHVRQLDLSWQREISVEDNAQVMNVGDK